MACMALPARARPKKKRAGQYHHGDLRRALLDEAAADDSGRRCGPPHPADGRGKARRVADRALPPFLRQAGAARRRRPGRVPDAAAGADHRRGSSTGAAGTASKPWDSRTCSLPSRTRRTTGSCSAASWSRAPRTRSSSQEAQAAFQVLVDSLVEQQQAGLVRRDDPLLLARFIWSVVHGIAMLVIDGQLRGADRSRRGAQAVRDGPRPRRHQCLTARPSDRDGCRTRFRQLVQQRLAVERLQHEASAECGGVAPRDDVIVCRHDEHGGAR